MKTKLLTGFLLMSIFANAQWQYVHTFNSAVYSFIASNSNLYAGLAGGGVYKSMDSGNTWEAVNNGIQFGGAYIFSLTSSNDSIYAGGFGEVCFSDNGGSSWSLLNLNLGSNSRLYALILKENYLFAGVGGNGMNNGVYRKLINGNIWLVMNSGLPVNVGINAFVIHNDILFAGTVLGVYKSIDNGINWTSSNNGISAGLSVKSLHVINGNLLAGTTNGIFVSSDHGSTWNYSIGLPSNSVATCFSSNNNIVVAGTYDGAFSSSDNGLTWTNFSDGLVSITSFYSLTSLEDYFYAGTGAGIFTTNPNLSTSISENSTNINVNWLVYPNPFSSQIALQANKLFKNATLTVYNLHGQAVKQIDNLSGQTIIFHRDNLPGGQYFIRLMQDDKVIATDKLIITDN